MGYYFEEGVIVEVRDFCLFIKIKSSLELIRTKSEILLSIFNPGDEIFVSWKGNSLPRLFKGQRYVNIDAIEKKGVWERTSGYERKFPKDNRFSFKAEKIAIEKLQKSGIRTEAGTNFEDEILGIDAWLFLSAESEWCWYPINFTLRRDLDKFANGSKYDDSFRKGVIPINLDTLKIDGPSPVVADDILAKFEEALTDFQLCGKTIPTREEAKQRELSFKN